MLSSSTPSRGSPARVRTPKRMFDLANREGTSDCKARKVSRQDDLQPGEVVITHRRVLDEIDCKLALAKIGISESVLVSESLEVLAEDADIIFQSLSSTREFRIDAEIIMSIVESTPGLQGNASFCRFVYAISIGCKEDGLVYEAVLRSGMKLFWEVLGTLAEDHPENASLKWMNEREGDEEIVPLRSFVGMFHLLEERHQESPPFDFIGGDVDLAEDALEVLKYITSNSRREKFEEVAHLMSATIPFVEEKILAKKKAAEEKKLREQLDIVLVGTRLPKRRLWKEGLPKPHCHA